MAQLKPAPTCLLKCVRKLHAVVLHLGRKGGFLIWVTTKGALQPMVPVIAVQRPVEHHKAARQTPVVDRAL